MVQQPTPPTMGESEEESDVDVQIDGEPEKEETEQELERLVFGDSAGFRQGLGEVAEEESGEESEEEEQTGGLEGLDDAAVGQANDVRDAQTMD